MRPYRWVARCCYLGMFVQAMVINLTPLLFIPLRVQFDLTFEQIGRLVLVNFLTQMVVDLICTALADRVNPKPLTIAANALAAIGLWIFAVAPFFLEDPYTGLLAGTVVFSIGCGLLEVLLSPIINAIPSDRKSGDMAFLHAFYPIGKVAVVVVTAVALFVLGVERWPGIMIIWSVVPIVTTLAFVFVQLPPLAPSHNRQTLRSMLMRPSIILVLAAMFLAGATEVTLAQWASAYVEKGLGFPKLTADLAGFGMFGVGMIIGRLWFGIHGDHGHLDRVMTASALLTSGMCLAMAFPVFQWLSLVACASSGFFVSMLWPGSLSLSAARYPLAGASLFALLAAAGDAGGALMPWTAGIVADTASTWPLGALASLFGAPIESPAFGLRAAFLVTAVCPLLMIPIVRYLAHPHSQTGVENQG